MKCCNCQRSAELILSDENNYMKPIEPIGIGDRKWLCNSCLDLLSDRRKEYYNNVSQQSITNFTNK